MSDVKTIRPATANEILYPPINDLIYDLDPYGLNEANRIYGEPHTVSGGRLTSSVNGRDYFILIPKLGPFFTHNFRLRLKPHNNAELIELKQGIDYFLTLPFADASRQTGKPLYAGIELVNLTLEGVIIIDYHTVGGEYCMDRDYAIKTMIEHGYNPLIITWDYIVNKPFYYNPKDHPLPAEDITGMAEVVLALERNGNLTAEGYQQLAQQQKDFFNSFNFEKFNQLMVAMDNHTNIESINRIRAMEHRIAYLEQVIANIVNPPKP